MFFETELKRRVEHGNKNLLYWDIPTGHTISLNLVYFISTWDIVFTITNNLAMYTV